MKSMILASTVALLSTNALSVLATPTLFTNKRDVPCTSENVTFNFETPPFLEFRNFTTVNASGFTPPSSPEVEFAPANATALNLTVISVPENETYTFDLFSFFIYANAPPTTSVLVLGFRPDDSVHPVTHTYTLGPGTSMMPINLTGVAGFNNLQKVIVKVQEFQSPNELAALGLNSTVNQPYYLDDFAIRKECAPAGVAGVQPSRF